MTYPWAVPLGLILASCGWWEGFAGENSPLLPVRMMFNVRRRMIDGTRYFVYLWVTVFKVLILKFPLLGDKMNLTVRLGKLFMRVPRVYQSCCPAPNCLRKQEELSGNCLPNLTVSFILSPTRSIPC